MDLNPIFVLKDDPKDDDVVEVTDDLTGTITSPVIAESQVISRSCLGAAAAADQTSIDTQMTLPNMRAMPERRRGVRAASSNEMLALRGPREGTPRPQRRPRPAAAPDERNLTLREQFEKSYAPIADGDPPDDEFGRHMVTPPRKSAHDRAPDSARSRTGREGDAEDDGSTSSRRRPDGDCSRGTGTPACIGSRCR